MRFVRFLCLAVILLPLAVVAQNSMPYAFDIPPWFAETLLDFRDEVPDAARHGKRLLVYFGQDGCPYCKALMQTNFSQKAIVEKTRHHFVAVALNVWGDRDVVWTDGTATTEKELARRLKVQFTPTVLFLDEQGSVVARLNGYYPPRRFEAALDYVAGRMEGKLPLAEHLKASVREEASDTLADEPFFVKPPYDLRRKRSAKPLVVLFETPYCVACDELHRDGIARAEVRALLARFDVVRLALDDRAALITPAGERTSGEAWARTLKVAYTPSLVFFDGPREVFRIEAYLRPFHLASSLEYVASRAYRAEPSFQRFVKARAAKLREKGATVNLWQ
jgi:thioredoxin-related protein